MLGAAASANPYTALAEREGCGFGDGECGFGVCECLDLPWPRVVVVGDGDAVGDGSAFGDGVAPGLGDWPGC
jgi:hypothetical protein